MLALRNILVPIDFSKRSVSAVEHGVAIANRFHSKLTFVHVVPLSPYDYGAYESGLYAGVSWPTDEQMQSKLSLELDALVKKAEPSGPVEKLILKGDPPAKIEELARKKKVDLIVMPTHGYGPLRRFVLGSVATKVLNDTSCPILTGSHMTETPFDSSKPYERIACAIDLQEHGMAVLKWARDFARACQAPLTVIHAAPVLAATPAQGQYFSAKMLQMLLSAKREELGDWARKAACECEILVESGEPERYVPAATQASKADVLIIGRSPLQGLLGRLRTHAHALIRESPCPVISV